jgi:hypothetical protein
LFFRLQKIRTEKEERIKLEEEKELIEEAKFVILIKNN